MNFFKKILLGILTLLFAGSLLIAIKFLLFDKPVRTPSQPPKNSQSTGTGQVSTRPFTLSVKEIDDNGFLRLINAQYSTAVAKSGELVKSSDGLYRYHKTIRTDLAEFFKYSLANNNGLYIASAFRSVKDQEVIYAKTKDKTLVQTPGNSEHHTGLALDLQPVKALQGEFGDALTKEKDFMEKNCWRFGFIQRYPKDKETVTGISFEYWHFRYVGRPHAEYISKNQLALEEYLDLLKYKGQLEIKTKDGKYMVYWQEPVAGKIQFLPGGDYEVSSTNTGAYVITVKIGD